VPGVKPMPVGQMETNDPTLAGLAVFAWLIVTWTPAG
jgi:hypothetical protein